MGFLRHDCFLLKEKVMLDIKNLKNNQKAIEAKLNKKDPSVNLDRVISHYTSYVSIKQKLESSQNKMKLSAKEIGQKKQNGEDAGELISELSSLKKEITSLQSTLNESEKNYLDEIYKLPNIPDDDVPLSLNKEENVCVKTYKEKPQFDFTPKDHTELNEMLNLFDFERGAKISGSGFPIYTGMGARLEWALLQLMVDTQIKQGFEFTLVPHLVKPQSMLGVGQLPKFESQLFKIKDEDYHLYLIPTSEVCLNGLHAGEIIPFDTLPKLYSSYSPCFRREAGSHGKQERGLIRTHQFNKVELFAFTSADQSAKIFEKMLLSAEAILEQLGLHYKRMQLVSSDTSFSAAKTIDIEIFLPGQNCYYEVSSVSNCKDFQARRSAIRTKREKKTEFVHTLNGSGLATSRLMVGLLETYQQEDGSIIIPEALRNYLGGQKVLRSLQ